MNGHAQAFPPLPGSVGHAAAPDGARFGDGLLCALLALYAASIVVEGVLRYAFSAAGLPNALYLRDAIPVGSIAFLGLRALFTEDRIDPAVALPAAVLVVHAAWAAMLGVAFFSIAFGLKILIFIPYGMGMWPIVRPRLRSLLDAAAVLLAVTLAGVLANFVVGRLPWEGFEYDTAFGSVSTTRLWWIEGGIARPPGFTRTSFDAAMVLGATGVLTLIRMRQLAVQLLVCCATLTAIVLTTSKGMSVAFPIAAATVLSMQRLPRVSGLRVVMALAGIGLVLPLAVVYANGAGYLDGTGIPAVLLSLWDRFTRMWPLAFELLPDGWLSALGAGIGGIGTPQEFGFSPHKVNAGDSLAVYTLVIFGLPGVAYYLLPALAHRAVAATQPGEVKQAYAGLMVLTYGYGMSISMLEEGFFALVFGLCCGIAASAWAQQAGREHT